MKYPISSLPIPAKGKLLTNNLTPDTNVPNLRSILGTNPSIQRRARLLSPQCHFSYVTPFPIPFPYDIEAPGPEEQEKYENDKGGYIEKWLSEREAVHPRTGGGGGRIHDSKGREQPAILLGLSETGLRDCFPHLEVGDSFQVLGVPALSPSDSEGDGKQGEGEKGGEARKELMDVLSGQSILIDEETGFAPWSMRYSGHQFGSWAGQLGDGRAVSILVSPHPTEPTSYELQLKGSGRTPFSRTADGLAVTRSSIREFLCSEYMQALSIPTTRSLSLISLPSLPVQREILERGCIMSRMAPSFIRIGNFEALNAPQGMFFFGGGQQKADLEALRVLGEWVAGPNVLDLKIEEGKPWGKELVLEVGRRNARMVAKWQVYGFMHGVINTDNVSILGLTIDYGPYAFMDVFDSFHICNHTDEGGRYAYKYQPSMIVFALRKLLASLAPLVGAEVDTGKAVKEGWVKDVKEEKVEEWKERGMKEVGDELERVVQEEMSEEYARAMRGRLGLRLALPTDETKISKPLLDLMEEHHLDFHSTFRSLSYFKPSYLSSPSSTSSFVDLLLKNTPDPVKAGSEAYGKAKNDIEGWLKVYSERLSHEEEVKLWTPTEEKEREEERKKDMLSKNPRFVLRQWVLEEVIKKVEGDVNKAAEAADSNSGSPDNLNLNAGGEWKSRRVLAKVLHMACNPFELWGGEVDPMIDVEVGEGEGKEGKEEKEELSEEEKEEKEERRFCGLGERKYLGFQCSCSS